MLTEFNGLVSRIVNLTKANMDALQLEDSTWVTQMKNAMNVNGGDLENATFIDYLLHFLTFFWKVRLWYIYFHYLDNKSKSIWKILSYC